MSTPSHSVDVAIVGAGASGLAAAAQLSGAASIAVLEARARIGGRILTRHEPGLPVPIELGAELVHGKPPTTFDWLARGSIGVSDLPDTRFELRRRRLQPAGDDFAELRERLRSVPRPRRDLPLREFLASPACRRLPRRVKELALLLVEGFDAADASRVSTLTILDEWQGGGAADAPTFRPNGGYAALLEVLAGAAFGRGTRLLLSTVIREIRWQRGAVELDALQHGRPLLVTARHAIVTLPLGVLQLPPQAPNAVRFAPALAAKEEALGKLASGPVIKAILKFGSAFWERLDGGRYADAAFWHARGAAFPTIWSMLPQRAPLLTAWAAGPNAVRLTGLTESAIVNAAIQTLQALFRDAPVEQELDAAFIHDWQADPYANGAYSYVVAGGGRARAALAAPLDGTLFFAGEATDGEGESGTVAGALSSGARAATEVRAALERN